MGLKEKLINRLKKHNGQMFEVFLETSEGFSTFTKIECADIYVREEIKNLGEDADYFDDELINIVEKGFILSFALKDEGIKSVEDDASFANDGYWIDTFTIEYESGTTIKIDVFYNQYVEENQDVTSVATLTNVAEKESIPVYNKDEYIKELLSRRYFPKDDNTLIEVLTTLKSLEGKKLIIEHSGDIVGSTFTIEEMVLEELIGNAIITEGIQLRDSYSDTNIFISEDRIKSIEPLDADLLKKNSENGYEIKFDDGSYLTIEVLKGN